MVKLIACVGPNGELGLNNKLVYNNKQDMKFFKQQTTGNVIIMGKNTFRSLGSKPLPNRINIVLTDEPEFVPSVLDFNKPLADVIDIAKAMFPQYDIYIIGGAFVYNQAIEQELADELLITRMFDEVDADTFIDAELMLNKYNIITMIDLISDDNNEDIGAILRMKRSDWLMSWKLY